MEDQPEKPAATETVVAPKQFPFGNDLWGTKFLAWLSSEVGISTALLMSLKSDDDWTFVIKMHGMLEAGLNHILLTQLGKVEGMQNIVSKLETSNARTGKLAFIKAYKLLSRDECLFVQLLSEVRNRTVHDIKNFDLDLKKYLQSLDSKQLKNWKVALTSWVVDPPSSEAVRKVAIANPRAGIHNSCMMILIRCLRHQKEAERLSDLFAKTFQEIVQSNEPVPANPTR